MTKNYWRVMMMNEYEREVLEDSFYFFRDLRKLQGDAE